MKSKTILGCVIALFLSISPSVFADVTQWRAEDGGNDHYYNIIVTPLQTWRDSKDQADKLGGYLASIRSPEENSWIWNTFNIGGTEAYWANAADGPVFGAHRSSDNTPWTWVSGESWNWSNWGWAANSGEAAAQFIHHSTGWDDISVDGGTSAGGNISFIVEWNGSAVPEPTSAISLLFSLGLLASRRNRKPL
ncbi:MAG: PEP-CTERM sorting domain-containing protein [Verrucomicrobiota bacterium]